MGNAFQAEGLILTATMPGDVVGVEKYFDINQMSKHLSFLSISDFGIKSKITSHIAPLKKHPNIFDTYKNLVSKIAVN